MSGPKPGSDLKCRESKCILNEVDGKCGACRTDPTSFKANPYKRGGLPDVVVEVLSGALYAAESWTRLTVKPTLGNSKTAVTILGVKIVLKVKHPVLNNVLI